MIEDNFVVKILHVSTGKLGTPTGHGKVYHKDLGWVEVPVGWMYSPSYIMPHIAIHGFQERAPVPGQSRLRADSYLGHGRALSGTVSRPTRGRLLLGCTPA